MNDKPRLPPEIIEQIVLELQYAHQRGDPSADRALSSLLQVSRLVRHWALQAKYSVVIAPRHVREFRRWIAKESNEMIGYNRALFVALDDVSKLTSTSAGWEADLQRLLQRLGPTLTHLSLWTSETRAILRDPAQIRGPRFQTRMPIDTLNDVIESTIKRRHKLEKQLRRLQRGRSVNNTARKPLRVEMDRDEQLTNAEVAAARERAKQKIPNWLQHELNTKKEVDVKRAYKAHFGTDVREYQHELDVQDGNNNGKKTNTVTTSNGQTARLDCSFSSDSDDDHDIEWGCMPLNLSICPSLPLHEHENFLNFARMTIWTRVESLEVFITVPNEVARYLELFSGLVASPLRSFRISSIYASLLIVCHSSAINIARGLRVIMSSKVLSSLLTHEFSDKHMNDVKILEGALESAIVGSSQEGKTGRWFDERLKSSGGLAATLGHTFISKDFVTVTITQGHQIHWGKLKDRKQRFLEATAHM